MQPTHEQKAARTSGQIYKVIAYSVWYSAEFTAGTAIGGEQLGQLLADLEHDTSVYVTGIKVEP
jgi:hypothetical protein